MAAKRVFSWIGEMFTTKTEINLFYQQLEKNGRLDRQGGMKQVEPASR